MRVTRDGAEQVVKLKEETELTPGKRFRIVAAADGTVSTSVSDL